MVAATLCLIYLSRWYSAAETGNRDGTAKDVWAGFDSDLPSEWESWLRFRRDNPPTDNEVIQVGYTKLRGTAGLVVIWSSGHLVIWSSGHLVI